LVVGTLRTLVDWGAVLFGALAACFWLCASRIKTPTEFRASKNLSMLDGEFGEDVITLAKAVSRQSKLNSWAAGFAALASVCLAVSTWIGTLWDH
jgi:hypothetical protein